MFANEFANDFGSSDEAMWILLEWCGSSDEGKLVDSLLDVREDRSFRLRHRADWSRGGCSSTSSGGLVARGMSGEFFRCNRLRIFPHYHLLYVIL